jgi:hypothetical protein
MEDSTPPARRRLWAAGRGFVALGLAVLSAYLLAANLSYFLAVVGLFDLAILEVADPVAVAAAVAVGLAGAVWVGAATVRERGSEEGEGTSPLPQEPPCRGEVAPPGALHRYILIADSTPSAVSGAWAVTRAEAAGGAAPAWKTVYFERGNAGVYMGSVREADGGRPRRFRYEVGPKGGRLSITFTDAKYGSNFAGAYELVDDRTLKLTGEVGGRPVELLLARLR